MKTRAAVLAVVVALVVWAAPVNTAAAQTGAESGAGNGADGAVQDAADGLPLIFRESTPLQLTLQTNYRPLRSRKRTAYQPAVLMYMEGETVKQIPLRVRTRGIFRLKNCEMAPIKLNFQRKDTRGTPLEGYKEGRLVHFCRNSDPYEQYVLREFQLYRVWNLLTSFSHRPRLVHLTYLDEPTGQTVATRYAFILEDDDEMAKRNGGKILKAENAKSGDLEPLHDALVGLFNYMIGNTDWSVGGLHNIMLIQKDLDVYATTYDFDFSGAVETRYARPPDQLPISSVRQRIFRGLCAPPDRFDDAVALFNDRKDAIYALYDDELGQLLTPSYVTDIKKYYDDFYKAINDRRAKERLQRACLEGQ